MKIYKYRDFLSEPNQGYFFQILNENRIWCAAPRSLNDEAEFVFDIDYSPSPETERLLQQLVEKLGSNKLPSDLVASYALQSDSLERLGKSEFQKMIESCRTEIGITSFSMERSSDWLWEEYAGNGNGAVVEFEVHESQINLMYHPVKYVPKRIVHIDLILKNQIFGDYEIFREILCTKTTRWEPEKEIRFLGKSNSIPIKFDLEITGIIVGRKVDGILIERIERFCASRDVYIYYNK